MMITRRYIQPLLIAAAFIVLLLVGIYLRTYLERHHALALAPYDAFIASQIDTIGGGAEHLNIFTDKYFRYPVAYLLQFSLATIPGSRFIVYLLGSLVLFFMGWAIGGTYWGGLAAMGAFAVATENLIAYTGYINPASVSYILTWAALGCLWIYMTRRLELALMVFTVCGLLAVTAYHSGGIAFILILVGMLGVQIFSDQPIDKKMLVSFLGIIGLYFYWLVFFDFNQLALIGNELSSLNINHSIGLVLMCFVIVGVVVYAWRLPWLFSPYWAVPNMLFCAWLIFFGGSTINRWLTIVDQNYYSSAVTLNNYLAQILLLHIYLWLCWPMITRESDVSRRLFLRGWIIGIGLVSIGLIATNYFSRIIDYSAPLMFLLFGWYWSRHNNLGRIIAPLTLVLLLISELMIYHDPFTMRRYYNQNEIDSAKKIVALSLPGLVVSDLRTAALFSYVGAPNVFFTNSRNAVFDVAFYRYEDISAEVDDYVTWHRTLNDIYVILSESMKTILYSTNLETKPISDETFAYYSAHYPTVYDDGLMKVFHVYDRKTWQAKK